MNLPAGFSIGHRPAPPRLRNCANEKLTFYNFDRMVYSPYGLTREEIAIIEESVEKKTPSQEVAEDLEREEM